MFVSFALLTQISAQALLDIYDRPLSPISARVTYDKYEQPADLKVKVGKKTIIVPNWLDSRYSLYLTDSVTLDKCKVTAHFNSLVGSNNGGTVDVMSISKRLFPDVPMKYDNALALKSKGGMKLGDSVLWVFSWDAIEVMSEPSSETFAIKVHLDKSGGLVVSESAIIHGLGHHLHRINVVPLGSELAMVAEGISLFDTQVWKETTALTEGQGCVAPSGHIYWSSSSGVSVYDASHRKFVVKGWTDLGLMVGAHTVDGGDIIVFDHGLFSPIKAYEIYRFPGHGQLPKTFYDIPGIGIGFIGDLPRSSPGIVLSHRYLLALAAIERS